MEQLYQPIAELLQRVASRRRRLLVARAVGTGALLAAVVLAVALVAVRWLPIPPTIVALVGAGAVILALVTLVRYIRPALRTPSDARLARFVEERVGTLDERLVSAVDIVHAPPGSERPVFAAAMVDDAARAAGSIDATDLVTAESLRRTMFQAVAASLVLVAVIVAGRSTGRRVYDSAFLALFPARVTLTVTPGDARVEAGTNLRVEARLVGNAAAVVPQMMRAVEGSDDWQTVEMAPVQGGGFSLDLNHLDSSFQYRVMAGGAVSNTYNVAVVRAPRVASVDVEYTYPKAFGLPPRTEKDGGDIYAPQGTAVTVQVHTDAAAASGQIVLADSTSVTLAPTADGRTLSGSMTVKGDDSYRVALADAFGLGSRGDTEYFIRTMDDRPPEVHVVRPASDRRVTPLEEVQIVAEAVDDFGIASLDLVYSVGGGKEQVVPLRLAGRETTVSASHLLYLEDLELRPGDFVSYYLRARDVPRGRRAAEVKSDIFFLEIKNFEEEFSLAQSQAAMGGGASNPQLDELVTAQKEVIVATWKLDRRSRTSNAQSTQDVRAVAAAQSELKTRTERVATSLRTSVMRDPRARTPAGRGGRGTPPGGAPPPRGPQRLTEEEAMTAAAKAMTTAAAALTALKTGDAIAPEMEALNRLLEAQSDIRKREVQRQQAGSAGGSNRATQDLSSLFDKELARQQQTNYENRSSAATRQEQQASAADKIRDLARRQDELLNSQQELARRRAQMSPEELKRELERLTRDQNELRERAEEVAQQLSQQRQNSGTESQPSGQQGQQGQQDQSGQQQQQGQRGQPQGQGQGQPQQPGQGQPRASNAPTPAGQPSPSSSGRGGQSGQNRGTESASERRLREASEDMRASAGELRRDDADQARARGQRALDRLRELEQQLGSGSAEGRRRAMGDLQLEARQLADAQRQIAEEQQRAGQGAQGADTRRRLAGEQQRLADRLSSVQQRLEQQAQPNGGSAGGGDGQALQQAAAEASREIERQRLAERMRQSAEAMRQGTAPQGTAEPGAAEGQSGSPRQAPGQREGQGQASQRTQPAQGTSPSAAGSATSQQEIARSLERIAERLSNGDRGRDAESQRLSEQRARAQELRNRLEETTQKLADLDREATSQQAGQEGRGTGRSQSSQTGTDPAPAGAPGQGRGTPSDSTEEISRLRDEMNRQLNELRELVGEARQDGGRQSGGTGMTFEGQGMVLSAPGTEGFKQDFARWQELKRQATVALETIESSASQRLRAKDSEDRLSTGTEDRPPSAYQQQVDSYFKALASKKTP